MLIQFKMKMFTPHSKQGRENEMSEIGNGYSWFKFDIEGWLSSPEVMRMNLSEKGVYITLLATQGRDGKLYADLDMLAKQSAIDVRVLKNWFKKWGTLIPILNLEPDTYVILPSREGTDRIQLCCINAPILQGGIHRANPKLWNLQVESGKLKGMPLLEEKRVDGIVELINETSTTDHTNVVLTMSSYRNFSG